VQLRRFWQCGGGGSPDGGARRVVGIAVFSGSRYLRIGTGIRSTPSCNISGGSRERGRQAKLGCR
jgi:hypothetical protein